VLSVEPQDETVTSAGDVVIFMCQLDGIPTPRTRWYRNTDLIAAAAAATTAAADDDEDEHFLVHNDNGLSILEIHHVRDHDAGYFRCEAGNGVEESVMSRFASLSFNTTLSSPTNSCMYGRVAVVCFCQRRSISFVPRLPDHN